MKTYQQLGTEIGELVERKNAAYGSSFAKAGQFLQLLYPEGIQPQQMADALLLVRIFDKQMRIATDRDALGESPYQDIAGYGILGAFMHEAEDLEEELPPHIKASTLMFGELWRQRRHEVESGKDSAPCPGSASDQHAPDTSKATAASVPSSTAKKTSPSNEKSSGAKRLHSHAGSSASTSARASTSKASAPVPNAPIQPAASGSEAGRRKERKKVSVFQVWVFGAWVLLSLVMFVDFCLDITVQDPVIGFWIISGLILILSFFDSKPAPRLDTIPFFDREAE